MRSAWLSGLVIVAAATPAAAQLTPQQRAAAEFRAVQYTIGETRQLEAERRSSDDALRGLRCSGAVTTAYGCNGARPYMGAVVSYDPATHLVPPRQWVAFGSAPQPREQLHELLGDRITLKAGKPTIMTLGSSIGGVGRSLMIRAAVRTPGAEPSWARMGEIVGDPQGRYLVTLPSLSPGTYSLDVQVYDPDRPLAPASVGTGTLIVR